MAKVAKKAARKTVKKVVKKAVKKYFGLGTATRARWRIKGVSAVTRAYQIRAVRNFPWCRFSSPQHYFRASDGAWRRSTKKATKITRNTKGERVRTRSVFRSRCALVMR